jgi:hypothetical protein
MTSRMLRRALLATAGLSAGLVAVAGPAGAHGAGSAGTEDPNYLTDFTDPGHPGLEWDVDIAHAKIRLTNQTGEEVTVYGYRSEPYLRFESDGTVWSNVNSPTTYLNRQRYGDAEIPPAASPIADPDWQQLALGGSHTWWDHRAHWMSTDPPEPAVADPDSTHLISTFSIPLRVGDTDTAATGELRWVPDLAWWPPILVLAGVFAAIGVAALVLSRPDGDRWSEPATIAAALIAMVAGANVIRGIDEAVNVADTTNGGIVVAISAIIVAAATGALAWRGHRGHTTSYLAILGAAFLAAIVFGGDAWTEIAAPQLVTGLPDWMRRWTIAASYAIVAPAGIVAFVAGRRLTPRATTARSSLAADPAH